MPLTTDQAVCIRVWDWSETSQTVSLFSRSHGVIRCVAKGAKRDRSAFSGGLEVLTRGEMIASIKPDDQLSLLTSWDLQELFPAVRASLSAYEHAMAMIDLVRHAITDHDPHEALFDALLDALRALDGRDANARSLLGFLWSVLSHTGHRPEVHVDIRSGQPLVATGTHSFLPRSGGFVTDADPLSAARDDEPRWRVRAETLELLRALAGASRTSHAGSAQPRTTDSPGLPPPLLNATSDLLARATRLLALYFREVFGVEPPALRPWMSEPR